MPAVRMMEHLPMSGLLGTRYYTNAMIDDSEMSLLIARQAQGKGRLKEAAVIKREVLSNRLGLCTAG